MNNLLKNITCKWREWISENPKSSKLGKHEAIKSFLVFYGGGEPEYLRVYRTYTRYKNGRVDYVDGDYAIEIDDAHNINAVRKLIIMEEVERREILWILHSVKGRSNRSIRTASNKYKIPLLWLHDSGEYNFSQPSGNSNRSYHKIKYKVEPSDINKKKKKWNRKS